ncbi:ribokinase [Plantibacter sp. VKM Ac-1784]|uniref:Ribokinase n=1 Tax=Plantibacter elymi (nom. nud.) TaxID=199708 RepID=A0ABY1RHU3_9MICO|nr:ribokinase [Plantibacter sp. VKM Ac-1784]SMQ74123.1 ribokinase [Plantibacter sp. VKM Ac-1784]
MQSPRIVVVGSLNADLVVRTARFPQPGETLTGSELAVIPGGKGANQAVAAGRLGGDVTMVGAVGDDPHGALLLESLSSSGVDVTRIARRDDAATGTAVITVDDAGENTIIVSPGANGTLTQDRIGEAWTALDGAGVACLCLEVPIDTVLETARRGAAAGALVLLNLSPYGPVPEELLQSTGVLLVNEHEAADLAGVDPEEAGWEATATALRSHGIRRAVVTTGAAGSVVIDGEADPTSVPSPTVDAVDTTGCGDAFMGALALRLAAGDELVDAARFASTVGSYAATGAGAQASYPDQQQLAAFLEQR